MKRWVKRGLGLGLLMAVALAVTMTSRAQGQTPSASGGTRSGAAPAGNANLRESLRTPLSLGKKLDIALGKHAPASPETVAKIKACIDGLVEIDRSGYGFNPSNGGTIFPAMPDETYAQALLLTDPKQKVAAEFKALVEWGPEALPYLLKALDDKRPTKMTVKRYPGAGPVPAGRMWFSHELEGNPMNPAEAKALEGLQVTRGRDITEYTVRVGDVCFMAIGGIVGRSYAAVRTGQYDSTIISPVEDADLCRRVRAAWSGEDARKVVWDSLLTDYATEAEFNGRTLEGWGRGNDYQIAAAVRMLYYFPAETAPSIAARLDKLDVKAFQNVNEMMAREVANGVVAKGLISAIRHSPAKEVRQAIVGIFQRAEDVDIMLAAAKAVENKAVIRDRIAAVLKTVTPDSYLASSKMNALLYAAATMLGDDAIPMMTDYVDGGGVMEAYNVAQLLQHINTARGDALLLRLLDDQRRMRPGVMRVCDMAASSLRTHHRELEFTSTPTNKPEEADKQIAAMKAALGGGKP